MLIEYCGRDGSQVLEQDGWVIAFNISHYLLAEHCKHSALSHIQYRQYAQYSTVRTVQYNTIQYNTVNIMECVQCGTYNVTELIT